MKKSRWYQCRSLEEWQSYALPSLLFIVAIVFSSAFAEASKSGCLQEAKSIFGAPLNGEEAAELCENAVSRHDPVHCFKQAHVYSLELKLTKSEAISLCKGARNVTARIQCFRENHVFPSGERLKKPTAINFCRQTYIL